MKLESLYLFLKPHLKKVDMFLENTLTEGASKGSLEKIEYVMQAPGKRLRPILSILTFFMITEEGYSDDDYERLIKVSSAIELIHMASLVHDDVIDHANERRNQPSVNQKWGNSSAVAFGVYLYSVSLTLIAQARSLEVLSHLSAAVKAMCEGELYQLAERDNWTLSTTKYMQMIQCKTANLFSAACMSGVSVSSASQDRLDLAKDYGFHLGMMFQLSDDYLDIMGDGSSLKKNMGQDLLEGQLTLPILMLRDVCTQHDSSQLEYLVKNKDLSQIAWLQERLSYYDIPNNIQTMIGAHHTSFGALLSSFKESKSKECLKGLASYILNRSL